MNTPTVGSITATAYGLRCYLARLDGYLAPGTSPRPIERTENAQGKPKSKPNLNLDTYDLIVHITTGATTAAYIARMALLILDGENAGWEKPRDNDPLKHITIYAQALNERAPKTMKVIDDILNDLHAKAERYLGITDPPVIIDAVCPNCSSPILRAAHEALVWCTNRAWHQSNNVPGKWDGREWLIANLKWQQQ